MSDEGCKNKLPGVTEEQRFLNLEYAVHNAGFIILLCIILCAVAGVFSGGYLSEARKVNNAGTLVLDYERFGRLQTGFALKISALPEANQKSVIRVGGEFNTVYEIENIWPQPDRMYSKNNTFYLVYNADNTPQKMTIWLMIKPLKPGIFKSAVQLNTGPDIRFNQLIYP